MYSFNGCSSIQYFHNGSYNTKTQQKVITLQSRLGCEPHNDGELRHIILNVKYGFVYGFVFTRTFTNKKSVYTITQYITFQYSRISATL